MATEIRFHLDENVDHSVARGLRLRGIDVTTTTDAELIGAIDETHITFALAQARVIVTHDPDFLALHANGAEHPGIVYFRKDAQSIGAMVRFLCLMHDCITLEDMRGQVEYG